MLQTTGSLRDSEADGGWAVDAQGRLVPALQVRQRFEYFLGAGGEVSDAEIRALIESGDLEHDEVTEAWVEQWAADLKAIVDAIESVARSQAEAALGEDAA